MVAGVDTLLDAVAHPRDFAAEAAVSVFVEPPQRRAALRLVAPSQVDRLATDVSRWVKTVPQITVTRTWRTAVTGKAYVTL